MYGVCVYPIDKIQLQVLIGSLYLRLNYHTIVDAIPFQSFAPLNGEPGKCQYYFDQKMSVIVFKLKNGPALSS